MNYIKQKRFSPKTPQPQQSHNPKQKARHSRKVTGMELIVGIEQFQNAYTSILTAVLASLFASFLFQKITFPHPLYNILNRRTGRLIYLQAHARCSLNTIYIPMVLFLFNRKFFFVLNDIQRHCLL